MSNYTIELGQIHECGNNIFDFNYDFYEPLYRYNWEQKFIEHYYFHEIGFETIGRFKQRLKSRLNMLYPKYLQLYKTELASNDIDFLRNKDLVESFERDLENNFTGENTSTSAGNNNTNSQREGIQNTSDNRVEAVKNINNSTIDNNSSSVVEEHKKQSSINNGLAVVDVDSLTNEEVNNSTNNTSDNAVSTSTDTNNINIQNNSNLNLQGSDSSQNNFRTEQNSKDINNSNTKEKTTLISRGNIGVTSSAELLDKWRRVLIDIQSMMIDDCKDLFMMLY